MSDRAIFNLVRSSILSSSEATNYESGAVSVADRDEVVLTDIFGDPCANPQMGNDDDRGIIHEYADGSEGKTPVVQLKTIGISVDFLGNDIYQKLARWKAENAAIHFNPGFGRRTEFAWRPLETSGATLSDLTGKYTLTIGGDATRNNVWDATTGLRVMRDGFTGNQRIVRTPGGAGQVFEGATTNRYTYDQPVSGTPGWTAGGAGSATITLTHVEDGFGHVDCPHSVRVSGTTSTAARYIASEAMPSAVDGLGTLNVGIFVKGRFPTGAVIGCYNAPGSIALSGEYGDWTWVTGQFLDTFVDAENHYIYINLETGTTGEAWEFELGPRTAVFTAAAGGTAAGQYSMPAPQWTAVGATRTADTLTTTANMALPQNGSIMGTFFVPLGYSAALTSQLIGIIGPSTGWASDIYFAAYPTSSRLRAAFHFSTTGTKSVAGYADGSVLTPGAVNTITATWNGPTITLYINGTQIVQSNTSANAIRDYAAAPARIGSRASGPFLLTGLRIEREPWTAARVKEWHISATDPRALGATLQARGRTFKIVSLPASQRVTAGGSYWTGNIVLKQVGYNSALSDIVTKEVL